MSEITKIVIHTEDRPEPVIVHSVVLGSIGNFELLALKGILSVSNDAPGRFKWAVQNPDGFMHLSDGRITTSLWGLIEDVLDHVTVGDEGQTLIVHTKPSADREADKRRAKLEAADIFIEEIDADCFAWTAVINGYTLQAVHHSSFGSALNDAEAFQKAMLNAADNAVYKVRQVFAHLMERKGIVSNATLHTVLAQLDEAAIQSVRRGET